MELTVIGMSCGGCANSVRKAINKVYPTAQVEVDLPTGQVKVTTDDEPGLGMLERARVEKAITMAGFKVETA